MTGKEIAAKLREALTLMNDNGSHWYQGDYVEERTFERQGREVIERAYCSLGAIRQITGTRLDNSSEASDELAFALAKVLPEVETEDPFRGVISAESEAFERIVVWNDDSEREWDDVVEKFTEAAERLEEEA